MTYAVPNYAIPSWNIQTWREGAGEVSIIKRAASGYLNTWYRTLPLFVVFTYFILYFLLPKFFLSKRKRWEILIVGLLFFAAHFVALYYFIHNAFEVSVRQGKRPVMPADLYILNTTIKSYLFNYPAAAGLAIIIKMLKRWWVKQKATEQLIREKARAELQLLKAQIHPHFLFNTLNNIYFFTLTASRQAPEMIKKLSGMLHYILKECDRPVVPLGKELKMLQDYIDLERIRYGTQLKINVAIPDTSQGRSCIAKDKEQLMDDPLIAPLLLIPFVENSFKHGASKMISNPFINLRVTLEDHVLHFFIVNGKPVALEYSPGAGDGGTGRVNGQPCNGNGSIGLKNVKKRLQLLYPGAHELSLVPGPETFSVYLKLHLKKIGFESIKADQATPITVHEMA
jgi:sensor histidine kinase YesM